MHSDSGSSLSRVPSIENLYAFFIGFLYWFQQAPVLKFAGTIRAYDFLICSFASLLFFAGLWSFGAFSNGKKILYFFYFSFFISLVSFFVNIGFSSELYNLYLLRFPSAVSSVRFIPGISVTLYFLNFLFCFLQVCVFLILFRNERNISIFKSGYKIGLVITCLYAMYGRYFVYNGIMPDFIPNFLDSRNSNPSNQVRPAAFLSEPGNLAFNLGLSLFVFYPLFRLRSFSDLFVIFLSFFVGFLTESPLFYVAVGLYFLLILIQKNSRLIRRFSKICTALSFALFSLIGSIFFSSLRNDFPLLQKIFDFVFFPGHTMSSGAFRSLTSQIGLRMGLENPIFGVGPGLAYLQMARVSEQFEPVLWGERITFSNYPQSAFALAFAEGGSLNFVCLVALFFFIFRAACLSQVGCATSIEKLSYSLRFGTIFVALSFLAIYPAFSTGSMAILLMMYSVFARVKRSYVTSRH